MNHGNLESYLTALERELQSLPTSEKAEILIEIKSHVMSKMEEDPSLDEKDVLDALGSPRDVAIKYVGERGIEWTAPKDVSGTFTGIVKWLVIGFLGTMGFSVLLVIFLITQFSPLVEVDEEKGKVRILGGMIDIDDMDNHDFDIQFNDVRIGNRQKVYAIDNKEKQLNILAKTGKLEIENSSSGSIEVDCHTNVKTNKRIFVEEPEAYLLDLTALGASKCEVRLPEKMPLNLKQSSGKLKLDQLVNPIYVDMNSGKIQVRPKVGIEYNYDFDILTGKIDEFASSSSDKALPVKIKLKAGKIQNLR